MSEKRRGQAKVPGKRGPADRFTPETASAIIDALSLGMLRRQACHVAGVDKKLFSAWRKQGLAAPDGKLGQFARDVAAAESRGIAVRLQQIAQAGVADWRASAWWLEHTHPEQFSKTRLEITGRDGSPIELRAASAASALSRAELAAELERRAREMKALSEEEDETPAADTADTADAEDTQ